MYRDFSAPKWGIGGVLLLLILLPSLASALSTTQTTWTTGGDTVYRMVLSYAICPASSGNNTITASVYGNQSIGAKTDANVFATIRKPDASSADYNFTNPLTGTYSLTYNFDQNGTYFIQAHTFKPGVTGADANFYMYIGDLNWTTSFVNNGFSLNAGDSGTIRNTVTNSDGNRVYDINANTTIYYPDTTVQDANEAMSQQSNGEFTHAIIGPSTAGTYTVATLFQCGPRFVWDHNGTFTINSTGGGGNNNNTGGSGGSSGSGGAAGGGSGGGGGGKRARIVTMDFDPALARDGASTLYATLLNMGSSIADYDLEFSLTAPNGSVYSNQKTIHDVIPHSQTRVIIDESVVPQEIGTYTLDATLHPMGKDTVYDTYTNTYNVLGAHHLALDVQPASQATAQGLTFPFTINLVNTGDFEEPNVQISWSITDPSGNEYVQSTFSKTFGLGESASFPYSPFIPIDAPVGSHTLVVTVLAFGVTQEKTIHFDVSAPNEYYAQLLADLELRSEQVQDKIQSLQQRGFDVGEVSLTLLDIRTDLANAKGMLLAGKFGQLNTKLLDLSTRITRLAAMVDALEQQSPLLSREGLMTILYAGVAALIGGFLYFLYWLRGREVAEKGIVVTGITTGMWAPPFLPDWLFTKKCYYSPDERKKLKRKPLLSRILGLFEKEEEP